MNRTGQSRKQFCADKQQHSFATKEWCNKQKHIGIRTLACKPARAPTCLPSSLPADRSAGVPACRHTDRRTCRQAIRKRAGSNMMWKRYGIKSRTVLLIFITKMCNKCTIMIRCLIFSIFQRNNFGNEGEKHLQQMYNNDKMFDLLYFSEE